MALLILIESFVYYSGLAGGFFFDDGNNIVANDALRISKISLPALLGAAKSGIASPLGRPISLISFALNYYFSGFDPFVFKATNLAIHCLNGILVFYIARNIIQATHQKLDFSERRILAGFVATAWLLHPIQLTSVLYVVQRMASLSAFFLFSAVLCHMAARKRKTFDKVQIGLMLLAWAILWPLSVLSKESGVLFPGFIAAYELIILRHVRARLDRFGIFILILTWGVTVGGGIYLVSHYADWLWQGYSLRPFTLYERLLTEMRVIWTYIGLVFLPYQEGFALYHDDIIISHGLLNPATTLFSLVGLCGLGGIVWWTRARVPVTAFSITWFLVAHSLESTLLPLEIAHEHRNYVALLGLLFLPLAVVPNANFIRSHKSIVSIVAAFACLAYLGLSTALRAHEYGEEVRRTQIEAMYHPASAKTNFDAGISLSKGLEENPNSEFAYSFARKHFERVGELDSYSKSGWLALIQLNCITHRPIERGWVEELSSRLQKTPFAPADRNVLYEIKQMAVARATCLRRSDIEKLFSSAFKNRTLTPSVSAILYSWEADYFLLSENDPQAAETALRKSLMLWPSNPSNQLKWAQLRLIRGHKSEAISLLKALRGEHLSDAENTTRTKLQACLEGIQTQCGAI